VKAGLAMNGCMAQRFKTSISFLLGGVCKMTKHAFLNSKIYQILWGGRINKKNNFPFGDKFEFQMDFELQFEALNKI
jgi:hypothetical protein